MAILLGTNDLKIYRRHASYCTRFPGLKTKTDTYRPVTKKDQKVDTCECPIWCRGYLAKETKLAKENCAASGFSLPWIRAIGAQPNSKSPACTNLVPYPRFTPQFTRSTTGRSSCGTLPKDTSSLEKMDR